MHRIEPAAECVLHGNVARHSPSPVDELLLNSILISERTVLANPACKLSPAHSSPPVKLHPAASVTLAAIGVLKYGLVDVNCASHPAVAFCNPANGQYPVRISTDLSRSVAVFR